MIHSKRVAPECIYLYLYGQGASAAGAFGNPAAGGGGSFRKARRKLSGASRKIQSIGQSRQLDPCGFAWAGAFLEVWVNWVMQGGKFGTGGKMLGFA